jgi:uncharacterized protein
MKAQAMIGMVALALLSAGAAAARAQAYAVGADGQMQQEKQAATIAPENQATTEQLRNLFEVMRIKQQMQAVKQMVPSMVAQQIQTSMKQTMDGLPAASKPNAEQRERMQQLMTKYVGKSMDLYPPDEMLTDMTTIYQRHLSKDDVEGLVAFYSSAPGQHLLDAQPVISQEYMPLVMGKVAERSRVLTQEMMKEMAAIAPSTKTGGTKPAAKAGTPKPSAK